MIISSRLLFPKHGNPIKGLKHFSEKKNFPKSSRQKKKKKKKTDYITQTHFNEWVTFLTENGLRGILHLKFTPHALSSAEETHSVFNFPSKSLGAAGTI